jgi:hypothetical protein
MTAKPVYIADIIGDVVEKVNTILIDGFKVIDPTIDKINFQYGPYKEVFGNLVQLGKTAGGAKKYPLVWLWLPNVINHGDEIGLSGVSPLRIIIARWGNPTDKTPARYTKNFKPFLYPIYLELLNQLYLDPRIVTDGQGLIPHQQTDWPYWGGDSTPEEANPLSDYVDAIEIKNLKINLLLKKC